LVKSVCQLVVQTQKQKLEKASAFLRACLAYCFITIPSIDSEFDRLDLYLLCGQVSLLCQSLPQADEMFKSAITLIKEAPTRIEEREGKWRNTYTDMFNYLKHFISVLVAVPGHPSHGPFYLLQQLQKIIQGWDWEGRSTYRVTLNALIICLLASNAQKKLPYKWEKVDSNDILYGYTQKHLKDIQTWIDSILEQIIQEFDRLKEYADISARNAQSEAIVEVIQLIIDTSEFTPNTSQFLSSLVLRERALQPTNKCLSVYLATLKANSHKSQDKNKLEKEKVLLKIEEQFKNALRGQ